MAVLCPRCQINEFTPYGEPRGPNDPAPPALSRVDNETYICTQCGTDEAMRDYEGEPPIPPSRWPLDRNIKLHFGQVPISQLTVPEDFWGPGTEPVVLDWLRDYYDPDTMPRLQVATIKGQTHDSFTLLGWNHEGTGFLPLLQTIFGEDYAQERLIALQTDRLLGIKLPWDVDTPLDGSHRG